MLAVVRPTTGGVWIASTGWRMRLPRECPGAAARPETARVGARTHAPTGLLCHEAKGSGDRNGRPTAESALSLLLCEHGLEHRFVDRHFQFIARRIDERVRTALSE